MKRRIIHIDGEKCNGCGACAEACHEGAIQMVDGKAKLVREDYCDGLGDCLPNCPTGAITFEEREAPAYDEAAVRAVLPQFIGPQDQVPPVFSAKIVNGLRAYEYARSGEPLELRTNRIEIYDIALEGFTLHNTMESDGYTVDEVVRHVHNYHTSSTSDGTRPAAVLRIRCSRGTYIRSLARDLGEALGSGAFLSSLRRTKNGGFGLEDALSLEEVLEMLD